MSAEPKLESVRSHGRTKWLWGVVGLVAAGLLISALYWPRGDVLEVNGVPFRIWVAQHPDFQIQDPLAAVGTNAVPHLIRILRERGESPRAFQAKTWIWKKLPRTLQSRFQHWYPVPRWQLKRTALCGLRAFGPEAKVALPEVLRAGHAETDRMFRASALNAALAIAPESPKTFDFWREEWEGTNYSRHDLAIYMGAARYPIPAASPLLLEEAKRTPNPVTFVEAFEFFGPAARPALPYMRQVFTNSAFRGNMMTLFRRLGPVAAEAVPDLAAVLTEEDPAKVARALEVLKAIGPDARSALPAIQPLHTNKDPIIKMLAAAASAHIDDDARTAVRVLLDGLEDRLQGKSETRVKVEFRQAGFEVVTSRRDEVAAILLGELGPVARPALTALEQRLGHSNQWVRLAAAQAVWRISRDAKQALPVLLAILDSQAAPAPGQSPRNYKLIRAIEIIEEIGPAARDAIPPLETVRPLSMEALHAVNAALAKIKLQQR